jgi:hypothetical protein
MLQEHAASHLCHQLCHYFRKRRDHIKGSFTTLRDQVPQLAGEKASRALILTAARDFISQVQSSNLTLEVEVCLWHHYGAFGECRFVDG